MRVLRVRAHFLLLGLVAIAMVSPGAAQSGDSATASRPNVQVHATLNQIMRGLFFPLSNVVFSAQSDDPATMKQDARPSASPNPLTGVFGGWEAVENSSLTLAESANLLTIPGRRCANGKPVPVENGDWVRFVQSLRDAGMAAFKAAQAKSQDSILEASERVAESCSNCHQKFRPNGGLGGSQANRCLP